MDKDIVKALKIDYPELQSVPDNEVWGAYQADNPTSSGLVGGPNATLSQGGGFGRAVGGFIGANFVRPTIIAANEAVNQVSMGFAPDMLKGTNSEDTHAPSYANPNAQQMVDQAAVGIGSIAGNMVGGELLGKAIGSIAKGGIFLAKKLPIVGKIIDQLPNIKDYTNLSRTTAREVKSIPGKLQKEFGAELIKQQAKNPNAVVSLTNALDNLIAYGEADPMVKAALAKLSKDKVLKSLIKNPKVAGSLSLKDAQNITNQIAKEMPTSRIANKVKFQFDDAIASTFKDMKKFRADYGVGMDDYELLSSLENTGSNIRKIRAKLVDQNIQDAAKRRLSEQLTNEMSKYSDAYNTLKNVKLEAFGMKTKTLAEKLQTDKLKPESKMLQFLKATVPQTLEHGTVGKAATSKDRE